MAKRWQARRMRDGLLHYGWVFGPFMPLHAPNCWCQQGTNGGTTDHNRRSED